MVECMKAVVDNAPSDLTLEERNLLSVAYKNVVGARRASLRIIGSIESKEREKGSEKAALVSSYKVTVEEELNKICADILELLDTKLVAKAVSAEAQVFYLKMKVHASPSPLLPIQTGSLMAASPHSAHSPSPPCRVLRLTTTATSPSLRRAMPRPRTLARPRR